MSHGYGHGGPFMECGTDRRRGYEELSYGHLIGVGWKYGLSPPAPDQFETEDNLTYKFFESIGNSFSFKVKAANDAHVALTTQPVDDLPIYEIFIGGWNNKKTALRLNKDPNKTNLVESETPDILSASEFREFWVEWDDEGIRLGRGNTKTDVIFEWLTPPAFPISHIGLGTGWGATGSWVLDRNWGSNETNAPAERVERAAPVLPPEGISSNAVWLPIKEGETIPSDAFEGGFDNETLYIGRGLFEGALIPGKVVPTHYGCYVAWGGQEHKLTEYEILASCNGSWVPSSDGEVPCGAVSGGVSENGETLYIGRAVHNDTRTPGKVQASHGTCYIPYGGEEVSCKEYEVLVCN